MKPRTKWTLELQREVVTFVLNGGTCKEAGDKLGLCVERIRQVITKTLRRLMHQSRMTEPMPEHRYWNIREVRNHREFWLRQLENLDQPIIPLPTNASAGSEVAPAREM